MRTSSRIVFAAVLTASFALVANARIEREVTKTFSAAGAGTLHVETQGGEIRVAPSSGTSVTVTAKQRIRADSDRQADELLQKLELTIEQDGNDIRVISKYEGKPSGFRRGSWPPVQVDIIATVPAGFATNLRASGGGITVGDLKGNAELRTSGGGIKLGKMGGKVVARTSGGGINVDGAYGPVDLKTSGGNISVGRVTTSAALSTSGGGIRVDSVTSALQAHTSGGSIRASITGPLTQECSLSTSGGSVRVNVDKLAAFRLDASTSGGNVDASGFPITMDSGTTGRSRISGTVNGGGPLLKLRASGGSITVRAE
jgi:hypothetical protein